MPIITFSFIFILLLFFLIINSIRQGTLETKYSILWIFVCISMAILSSTDKIINWIGQLLKVEYPPSVLFLFGLLFCFVLIFDLTRKISKFHHQLVTLTQDYALLKQQLEHKEQQLKSQEQQLSRLNEQ
ncbi:DUF2304 domain-containing protein [Bacillus cytotoxicus]|uniref:DUF2304 domain-containing protein n=3 Tax=Bacillus cytotoxicus TaxID=580165 RepID=A0AAX2CN97_9BACI|nr:MULTISPECIES: DUF2304 domain-containing protein [Bacillus cereus group]ABS24129.1 conserved hypothetical protein [Bacillus cytotoxicus NVH 391-98]AWC30694.1 DUF2304 domain-containing protein [Bacillus cytotoxicus]AWC34752.1 DUF2304 domain-containing protein [Bacillus cytotoxicus]AWC38747.1 DUF2304 domain-containing protein [Bacillus cytotoxicus]AWC42835.1 DUF2304 domain-containing protein [Bacillus cytotoxicus]